jgi:hypothetical protein
LLYSWHAYYHNDCIIYLFVFLINNFKLCKIVIFFRHISLDNGNYVYGKFSFIVFFLHLNNQNNFTFMNLKIFLVILWLIERFLCLEMAYGDELNEIIRLIFVVCDINLLQPKNSNYRLKNTYLILIYFYLILWMSRLKWMHTNVNGCKWMLMNVQVIFFNVRERSRIVDKNYAI